jgi:hypothetical protein
VPCRDLLSHLLSTIYISSRRSGHLSITLYRRGRRGGVQYKHQHTNTNLHTHTCGLTESSDIQQLARARPHPSLSHTSPSRTPDTGTLRSESHSSPPRDVRDHHTINKPNNNETMKNQRESIREFVTSARTLQPKIHTHTRVRNIFTISLCDHERRRARVLQRGSSTAATHIVILIGNFRDQKGRYVREEEILAKLRARATITHTHIDLEVVRKSGKPTG